MPPVLRSKMRQAVATSSAPRSWVPQAPSPPDEPLKFTIDLSLPPEQRYLEVCAALKHELRSVTLLFDEVVGGALPFLPIAWVRALCRVALRRIYDDEENRELHGISKATGLDMYLLVCFNVLLDLFMGCSSGGVVVCDDETERGAKMVHFRTLDWDMPSLRRVLVQLAFKDRRDGPTIATSITYAGFVGVLTGVRRDFSESLNFRPNRNNKGRLVPDCQYYWHLLLVLLGWRPSIASVLRKFLLPWTDRKGKRRQPGNYRDTVQSVRSGSVVSTACYLCFSDGSDTTVIEKDRVTSVLRSDQDFIVVTNSDTINAEATSGTTSKEISSRRSPALQEIIEEAQDRKQCAEDNWILIRNAMARRKGVLSEDEPMRRVLGTDEVVWLVQRFPTTNEMTHFACVMDPRAGEVSWCRRWKRAVGAKWIREHQAWTP